MADSQSSRNSVDDKSPVTNLAEDHLFSILLLLPVNSILSFALTCRRFNSLISSDTLWEPICRRDWGSCFVDDIKSSAKRRDDVSWLKVYKQVLKLECVSCRKLIGPNHDEFVPGPRASHSLNLVSNCLVLFGGGSDGGRHLDDTWVACLANGTRPMKWQKTNSGTPTGRFGHTCVVVGDSLILFGGINDCGIRQNDTWIGQISQSETLGITLSWKPLNVGAVAPPPRGAHSACCIDRKRMLVYGGIGLDRVRVGDTWILELSENFLSGTWHEILSFPSPPARSGHTLSCIDGGRIVLFGGRGIGYEVLSDVWLFYTSEGHQGWKQVPFDLINVPGGISLPRVGHSATVTPGGRLLIYGGEDSQRRRNNDFWLLDINSIPTVKMHSFSTRSVAFLTKMWRRLKAEGYKTNPRSFHAACTDHSGCYLYVFGGMVDGLVQPVDPSGLRFDGECFLVELVLHL